MRRYRCALLFLGALVLSATFAQGAAAAAPVAITGPVSEVGGASATLNGTVNPAGGATDWWFEYGTSTSYGSKTATTAAGSGTANVAVSKALSGLAPGTTYHYRLVARNSSATTQGVDGLFSTASPPTAVTLPANGIGPTAATLSGTANPNGQATDWYFEYGASTSYGTKTSTTSAGSGTSSKSVSTGISGLGTGKTYHYRLVASSSAGVATGADQTFVTAKQPGVTTSAASSVSTTSAKLNGKIDPNGRSTTYYFEFGPTTSYGTRTSSGSAGSGSSSPSVSTTITGLSSGTTYHFRIVAASDAGTVAGADRSFTTTSAPTVSTGSASGVGATSATLAGSVNPNGRSTSWYFEYGKSTKYGSKTSSRGAGSGKSALDVIATISRLTPGTTYHFRVVASSSLGKTGGADSTFTTMGAPLAVTGSVDFPTLSLFSTRVRGTVNPRGLATTWWIEYGRTNGYGRSTSRSGLSAGTADVRVDARLSSLTPGVRWHYRVVAQSAAGTSVGSNKSFGTPPRPRDSFGRAVRCTIVGTQGRDVIRGTSRRDVICALGGNDRIFAGGGADIVYGGPGADVIAGGNGRDVLRGDAGNDVLRGGAGNDTLSGGVGADKLYGGGNADALNGGRGNDVLRGDRGNDVLRGGNGNDTLFTKDARRDVAYGGRGRDLVIADRRLDRLFSIERRRYS